MKKLYTISFLLFASLVGFAQLDGDKQEDTWMEDNIFLDGIVTDYYSGKAISGVTISVRSGGVSSADGNSDAKGEYKTVLKYDKTYTVIYSKSGYTSKIIYVNTSGVPDLKKQKVPDMLVEITLFKPNDCIKTNVLDGPIGKAKYFPKKNVMDWDMDYSMPRLAKLNKMLDKCKEEAEAVEEAKKEQERKYNELMKIADRAFTKEEYEKAIENYQGASALYPDNPEPKEKIKLINTELAKKAEAEKQRVEEKVRAEAEAVAKAEAEAAAKKAEEERIAKEKAEAEVKAKSLAEEKEKAKAIAAAKKAEKEKLAKEKAKAEALAKKVAAEKAKFEKEAEAKKLAEEKARAEERSALAQMKEEEKAKILAQKEASKRAQAEAKAIEEQQAAKQRELEEKTAKETAAQLAKKAEDERAINAKVLVDVQAEVSLKIEKRETQEKLDASININIDATEKENKKSSSPLKFKKSSTSRHLYVKPNKHKKGKGPQPKKRIVF